VGPHFYACGPEADVAEFAALSAYGADISPLDGPIGGASALKMCQAAINKAFITIGVAVFDVAARNGIAEVLAEQYRAKPKPISAFLPPETSRAYRKAYRWVGEMHEIATFCGDDPNLAAIYDGLAGYCATIAEQGAGISASA
jgi:hypothetical protein